MIKHKWVKGGGVHADPQPGHGPGTYNMFNTDEPWPNKCPHHDKNGYTK